MLVEGIDSVIDFSKRLLCQKLITTIWLLSGIILLKL